MNELHPLETLLLENKGVSVYAVRIAKVEGLAIHKTDEYLRQNYDRYILSEEGAGARLHQHIVIIGNVTREQISTSIKWLYPDAFGNKCLYIQIAKSRKQLLKYTVKEGDFLYKGFTKEFIDDLHKCSQSKTDLISSFNKLDEELKLDKISFKQYINQYILLKARHNQPLYSNHLLAFFRTKAVQTGQIQSDDYANSFFEKIIYGDK